MLLSYFTVTHKMSINIHEPVGRRTLKESYQIPHRQHTAELLRHGVMLHGHEECIQNNADGDG